MKNVLIVLVFVGFTISSYAFIDLTNSPENIILCEGKCEKKDCKKKSKCCKKGKASCKKNEEKKSCCKKGEKKKCPKKEK